MEGGGSRKMKPSPLKISRESRIRKPPVLPPIVQIRRPVIIHTYSPKVIETDADNFMWLVQRLTGSIDTRLRCKVNKPATVPASMPCSPKRSSAAAAAAIPKWKSEEHETTSSEESSAVSGDHITAAAAAEDDPHQNSCFRVDQMLLSPSSSSDSGLFNSSNRVCAPLLASPKSPLVSYDAQGTLSFQFGDQPVHPFATSSALATNSEPFVGSSSHQSNATAASASSSSPHHLLQFPWSPIPTPNGLSHDILNDFPSLDLWTGASADSSMNSQSIGYSRLFGPIPSPASIAFRDMAFEVMKDSSTIS